MNLKSKKGNRIRGQGLIEYILLILMVFGIYTTFDYQIKKGIGKLWKSLAKDIAAGCPGCEPPGSIR